MAQKEFVGKAVTIQQELVFDFKDFYKMLKSYLKDLGYGSEEKEYHEGNLPTGERVIKFTLECDKKVEDYVKLVMNINVSAAIKDVEVEKEGKHAKVQKGKINIGISGYLKKDSEDEWAMKKKSAFLRFIREIYDKFFIHDKMEMYAKQLAKDQEALVYDLKTFLKLKRLD